MDPLTDRHSAPATSRPSLAIWGPAIMAVALMAGACSGTASASAPPSGGVSPTQSPRPTETGPSLATPRPSGSATPSATPGSSAAAMSSQAPLPTTAVTPRSPAIASEGRIAFGSGMEGYSAIYVMYADGTGIERVTPDPAGGYPSGFGGPAWSPDGARIAFTINRDVQSDIYVSNADGTGVVRLTNSPAQDGRPTWSPDGTKMAFGSFLNDDAAVYVMNADGTGATRLTDDETRNGDPAWSPDGSKIAFVRFGQSERDLGDERRRDGSESDDRRYRRRECAGLVARWQQDLVRPVCG